MPWYWLVIILSLVIGPFDALYLLNKAWKKKQKDRQKPEENPKEEAEKP